jgi:hypothetical protein
MIVDRKVSIEISKPAEAIFVKKMLVTHTHESDNGDALSMNLRCLGLPDVTKQGQVDSARLVRARLKERGKGTHENRTARG